MTNRTCSIDGCARKFKGRGLCNMHLIRLRRKGDVLAHVPGQIFAKVCGVDDCDRKPHANGFCNMHARRWQMYGDPTFRVIYPKVCMVDNCTDVVIALGMCSRHYRRAKYKENPRKEILKVEKRRAKRANAPRVDYLPEHVAARFAYFGDKCWMCGSMERLTIDHVKPLNAGGPDMPSNLRPACRPCNSRKRDRWFGVRNLKKLIV